MSLYNKAIEYYSAKANMEKSMEYLNRLKELFAEPELSAPQQSADTPTPTPSE